MIRATRTTRLITLGALLGYLATLPFAAMTAVSVAYARFSPTISSRDDLHLLGSASLSAFYSIAAVAIVVVFVTIAVWWSPRAWLVPVGGLAVTILLWCLGVALMQTPPPQLGG
jgi:ABC-type sulfate transport system permease component